MLVSIQWFITVIYRKQLRNFFLKMNVLYFYFQEIELPCFGYNILLPQSHLSAHISNGSLKYWEQRRYLKKSGAFISYFVHLATFVVMLLARNIQLGWGVVLKYKVPESVRFCIGVIGMYTFFILRNP